MALLKRNVGINDDVSGRLVGAFAAWVLNFTRPARLMALLLSISSLAIAIRASSRHTDSIPTFANSLTVVWLIISVRLVAARHVTGLGRVVLVAWVTIGCLRSVVAVWGVSPGWILTQTIDVQSKVVAGTTHVATLDFDPGNIPAHLINDNRLNFYREGDPNRSTLPVGIAASSYVAGRGSIVVSSSDPIRISVGSEVTELRPPIKEWRRSISVSREQLVTLELDPSAINRASLSVRSEGIEFFSGPTAGPWMTLSRLLGKSSPLLDVVALLGSLLTAAVLLWHRLVNSSKLRLQRIGMAGLTVFLSVAPYFLAWLFQHESLVVLSGGDDWLTYESFSREIRDNSILMPGGRPLGQGEPYYYQVLYPYAVALGHLVLGESVQGVLLLQLASAALLVVLSFRMMPREVWPALALSLLLLGTGIAQEWALQAGRLLSENLLLLVYAFLILVISRLRPVPTLRSLLLVGLLLGIGGITRSTTWLAVPFILGLLCRDAGRTRWRPSLLALLVPILLVSSLVPMRNAVVSGKPEWLPGNGSVTLAMGNIPPGRKLRTEPWLELSKHYDPNLVAVAEAAVDDTGEVAERIARKAVYVLGFPKSMDADNPWVFWPILSLWLLSPLALLVKRHSRLEWACLILACTHAVSLVIVHPNYYYYRLEMPATLPLAVWDAIALSHVLEGLREPSGLGERFKRRFMPN